MNDSKISAALRSRIRDLRATAENQYQCTMEFDPGFTGFEGHFEGNPIVPGVCLIQAARTAAEMVLSKGLAARSISNCRFRRPVLAGERAAVRIRLEKTEDELWTIRADIRVGGGVCAQLQLKAAEL